MEDVQSDQASLAADYLSPFFSCSPQFHFEDIHPGTRVRTPDTSKEPHFTEWKSPVYKPLDKRMDAVTSSRSQSISSQGIPERNPPVPEEQVAVEQSHGAGAQAEEYRALIYDVSPESPESSANPFRIDSDFEPSPISPMPALLDVTSSKPMAPRISDVLDQPLMPELLNVDDHDIDEEVSLSSHLSFDTKISERSSKEHQHSLRESKGECNKDSLRKRPSSRYPEHSIRPDFAGSFKETRNRNQRGLTLKQHRKSVQQGVSDAYESLHRKISVSSKPQPKPAIVDQPQIHIAREFRSLAVPMTAYQQYGKKAWEIRKGSSKFARFKRKSWLDSSPEMSPISIKDLRPPRDMSKKRIVSQNRDDNDESTEAQRENFVSKKWASAFQNGTTQVEHAVRLDKDKSKKAKKIEERREELRKKIVVVLPKGQPRF